ncbi:hypothetical protein AX16_006528 [Volvariella volvacea WC 439]|nr:hypothetical protein AX16_006528 [Volvariella volvacea WC 439]
MWKRAAAKAIRELVVEEDPNILASAQAVNRSSVASLAFLVWDIIITFDEEVKVIWPNPCSYSKVLYFFVRYLALIVQISILFVGTELSPALNFTEYDCFIWQVWQGAGAFAILSATDLVLILRVHALYRGNTIVRVFLAVIFVGELVVMATGLIYAIPDIKYDHLCRVTQNPPIFLAVAAAPIGFQTILFLLTGWKFIQAIRAGWGDVPLIQLLMRDGTWAFFLLFLVLLAEALLYGAGAHGYAGVLFGWLLTAFSFSGYRIMLNIHHMSHTHQIIRLTTTTTASGGPTTSLHLTSHFTQEETQNRMNISTRDDANSENSSDIMPDQMIPLSRLSRSRSQSRSFSGSGSGRGTELSKQRSTRAISFVDPAVDRRGEASGSRFEDSGARHASRSDDVERGDWGEVDDIEEEAIEDSEDRKGHGRGIR